MQAQELIREFTYNSVKLADPNPAFTLTQVRDFFATVYPEIINADVEGPDVVGNKNIYKFRRAVGTKGSDVLGPAIANWCKLNGVTLPAVKKDSESTRLIKDLAALEQIGWFAAEPKTAKMIQVSMDFVEEQPDFVLSAHHFRRIEQLHAANCSRIEATAS